ncbi:MAG TPA: SDR family oxidoreductase [Anaeromyxobacteraceae bacterium]|nr:SDR family oxidoreductase [Anaeromyxobacteraceae bacterium]
MPPRRRPVALVTGAGVRVGHAVARDLVRHGWRVAAHFRSHRPRGFDAALEADLAKPDGPGALAAAFRERFDRLDLLVNAAAAFDALPVEETDAAAFDSQMDVNARAPLLLTRALLRELRAAGGSVVNLLDVGGALVPWRGFAAYAASKAALARLTECLALELAPEVRVNGIAPGVVLFPEGYDAKKRRALTDRIPLRRTGAPEDVAAAVRYLAGATFVTGAILPIDGGRHLSGRVD